MPHHCSLALLATLGVAVLTGCATTESTNPENDDIVTAIKCTFTTACDNYIEERKGKLGTERKTHRTLEDRRQISEEQLSESEERIATVRTQIASLDSEIARMQAESEQAAAESEHARLALGDTQAQLEQLRRDAQALDDDVLNDGVLREDLDVSMIERRRAELEERRKVLETALLNAL